MSPAEESVYSRMRETIAAQGLIGEGDALLLMVSGGSDSTALAYLMARLRDEGNLGAMTMLHMNHKLRGKDADEDAGFVAALADTLNIPLFSCEMDIAAEAERIGDNIEAVARRERYNAANEALISMCQHEAIPLSQGRIVTAHTADDRVENFYMRSIVGTGPGGFRSMLYRNGSVVRPLLDCSRDQLRDMLTDRKEAVIAGNAGMDASAIVLDEDGECWREDATNAHTDRFRAFVRHEIIPKAKEWNPQLLQTLCRTMNLIGEEDDMLDAMVECVIKSDVDMLGDDVEDGFLLRPTFGEVELPIARRVVHSLLKSMLGADSRVDSSSVDAVLEGFADGVPASGYVSNIQGNLAVSANKQGVRVEQMADFRARRKK